MGKKSRADLMPASVVRSMFPVRLATYKAVQFHRVAQVFQGAWVAHRPVDVGHHQRVALTTAERGQDLLPLRPDHSEAVGAIGSWTRMRLNDGRTFSGISLPIVPPMLATPVRRLVSCLSRRVDSRASKIHLSWPG
jgi:hypothetical protein